MKLLMALKYELFNDSTKRSRVSVVLLRYGELCKQEFTTIEVEWGMGGGSKRTTNKGTITNRNEMFTVEVYWFFQMSTIYL